MKKLGLLCLFLLMIIGCSPTPKPIYYGVDACQYCKMTIVDSQHAAEVVTQKGKVYKFDAIECMINFSEEAEDSSFAFELVNDYQNPTSLIHAAESYYLISKAIPSPMGAYLSAFKTENAAQVIQKEKGGQIYDWSSLKTVMYER